MKPLNLIILGFLLVIAGCSLGPVQEIAKAKAAVTAAKAAGAEKYFSQEFKSIQDSLDAVLTDAAKLNLVNPLVRSYKKIKARLATVAADAERLAQKADREKAEVRKEVNADLEKLDSAITATKELMQLAPKEGKKLKTLLETKAKEIEATVKKETEIQSLKNNGEFLKARQAAESAVSAIGKVQDEITSAIENAVPTEKKK
ncbi:MAG TPA: hypothetical protein VLX68_12285 [Chitinivibrionales bacterium]|nr:hypothetical protein [Chitinivibrionales bacterium]